MKDHRTILPVNGVGPAVGKSPRDYLRERAMRESRMFAGAYGRMASRLIDAGLVHRH